MVRVVELLSAEALEVATTAVVLLMSKLEGATSNVVVHATNFVVVIVVI